MADLFGIHWAGADRIIYFPLVVILIALIVRNYVRIWSTVKLIIHPDTAGMVFKHFSLRKQAVKAFLLILAVVFIFLALLQPQWGKKEQHVVQEGRDLLILLDISRSMLAQDLKPNRLDFAKLKVRSLLNQLPLERVGLILFSGSAFLQCPLTADHAAFLMFLNQVDTETISSGTTALDGALLKAIEVFEVSPGRKNKLVLLITDGEDFSLHLNVVERKASDYNIRLFTLGVGTVQGAPIPRIDAAGKQIGHEVDEAGNIVLSSLNETLLQGMCNKLHGNYLRASYDDSDLNRLSTLVKSFEKESFEDKKISMYEDQYPWLLGVAWVMLALEWML
jgi:Ca-activated chloride channel homolog